MKEKIFTEEFLEEIGFERTYTSDGSGYELKNQYGKAQDKRTKGMTILEWNNEGHSCTYFGEPLESNVSFGIKKDAGTRNAFNGYVYNQEQVKLLLNLTL